jgi:hypothetical protein
MPTFPLNMISPLNATQPMSTAEQTVADQNTPDEPVTPVDEKTKKRNELVRAEIQSCKNYRQRLVSNWSTSIDMRRGKPFTSQTDEETVNVPSDWILTKAKMAALFSQLPAVHLDHHPDSLPDNSPFVPTFERRLNDLLRKGGVESAMDECLPDCINAAGIGVVLVSYEAITEDRELPGAPDPTSGEETTESVPYPVDKRYCISRISPADFLWPVSFVGSNFDNAPLLGRSGRTPWPDAKRRFGLTDEEKTRVLGDSRTLLDRLTHDAERENGGNIDERVSFDEVFIKDHYYDEDAKSFCSIRHLVFVAGKDEPVIDEPWKGQQQGEDGGYIGAEKYPLRVLTLDYISDEAIPPSSSAIGRTQVNELNKSRGQIIKQRERSLPLRWMDVNRVDPSIQHSIMRGTWQAAIPVQGDGGRALGEVARSAFPPENFEFDKIIKGDLHEAWTVGPTGQQILEAKGDSEQLMAPFNTQAGRERARVTSFIIGIAEVLGGLMCLYEDPSELGEGFTPAFSKSLCYSIVADSTVLVDTAQRIARLDGFINKYAKSGFVNIEPLLHEVATLHGLDPKTVIKAPEPKPPETPNISLRLTGVEDLLNPLALAMLVNSGQAPKPEMIEQAKQLIQQSVTPPFQPEQSAPGSAGQQLFMMGGGQPEGPPVPGQPPAPGVGPQGPPLHPPVPAPPPGTPLPQPAPHAVGEAHPSWTVMSQLDKRSDGGQK